MRMLLTFIAFKMTTVLSVSYRLVDGPKRLEKYEGRLEVSYLGEWGTVCNQGFNDKAAQTVCGSLGLR